MANDPTTAAIEEAIADRDRLRKALRDLRDHYVKAGRPEIVAEIDKIVGKAMTP
jgi:uncharacterized protein YbcI